MLNVELQNDESKWMAKGESLGWEPPTFRSFAWRLPIVRHIRTIWNVVGIERHYARYGDHLRTGYDEWVVFGMWRGWCG